VPAHTTNGRRLQAHRSGLPIATSPRAYLAPRTAPRPIRPRRVGFARPVCRARAAVVVTTILQILESAPPCELRRRLEQFLRDEFARPPD
jgi:hypothetical protein